jgi:hypothetical protein
MKCYIGAVFAIRTISDRSMEHDANSIHYSIGVYPDLYTARVDMIAQVEASYPPVDGWTIQCDAGELAPAKLRHILAQVTAPEGGQS